MVECRDPDDTESVGYPATLTVGDGQDLGVINFVLPNSESRGVIKGTLRNQFGQSLGGTIGAYPATEDPLPSSPSRHTSVDGAGAFRLGGLLPGGYKLAYGSDESAATFVGFDESAKKFIGVDDFKEAYVFTAPSGDILDVPIVIDRTSTAGTGDLYGIYKGASGEPLAGIDVYLYKAEGAAWQHWYTTTPDANGVWRFSDLEPDAYRIGFKDQPWADYNPVWYAGENGIAVAEVGDARSLTVAADRATNFGAFTRPVRNSVSGTVTNAADRPVANVEVSVFTRTEPNEEWYEVARGRTNGKGRYEIADNLEQGYEYRLSFEPQSTGTYQTLWWPDASSPETAQSIKFTEFYGWARYIDVCLPYVNTSKTWTVTFDSCGGEEVRKYEVLQGMNYGALPKSTREGFGLTGWFTQRTGGVKIGPNDEPTDNITLFAQWVPLPGTKYTVTIDHGGVANDMKQAAYTVDSGALFKKPTDPKSATHDFAGWYADAGYGTPFNFNKPITGNVTIYAKWTKKTAPQPPQKNEPKEDASTDLSKAEVEVADKVYTGKRIKTGFSVTVNGKTLKPGVDYTVTKTGANKKIGQGSVTISARGAAYTGTKTVTFKINPTKIAMKKVKTGKKSAALTWKKSPKAQKITGYQLRYRVRSTNNYKTIKIKEKYYKKTIKKLRPGKVYCFSVRSYKKVGEHTYYSAWSAEKKSGKIRKR
jgi:uncharacterized repeat protein (TIGR02543 family)